MTIDSADMHTADTPPMTENGTDRTGAHAGGAGRSVDRILAQLRACAASNGGTWWKDPRACGVPADKALAECVKHLFTSRRWVELTDVQRDELMALTGRAAPGESRRLREETLAQLRAKARVNGGRWWRSPGSCMDPAERSLSVSVNHLFTAGRWRVLTPAQRQELVALTGRNAPNERGRPNRSVEDLLEVLRAKAASNGGTWWTQPKSCFDPGEKSIALAVQSRFTSVR